MVLSASSVARSAEHSLSLRPGARQCLRRVVSSGRRLRQARVVGVGREAVGGGIGGAGFGVPGDGDGAEAPERSAARRGSGRTRTCQRRAQSLLGFVEGCADHRPPSPCKAARTLVGRHFSDQQKQNSIAGL